MKTAKCTLVLVLALAMLLMLGGYAEEQGETELTLLPAEGMEVPEDEALGQEEAGEGDAAPAEPVTLTLDPTSATLDYSQSVVLTAAVPAGAESVTWTSSDENVASLSATSGESVTVIGVNEGTATITCASGELTQICEVTVKAPETLQITGVDYPATFQLGHGGWNLRNGTVASVDDLSTLTSEIRDANGELIGKSYTKTFSEGEKRYDIKGIDSYVPFSKITAEGQCTWTLTATDASGRLVSMRMAIHATAGEETVVANEPSAYSSSFVATEIALDSAELVMQPGETRALIATVQPGEAVNGTVTWASGDPSVATVTQSGEVTAVGVGTTAIACTALGSSDVSASCAVTVSEEAENVEATPDSADVLLAAGRNLILNSGFEGMTDAGIYTFNGDEVTFHATDFGAEGNSFSLNLSEYGLQNVRGGMLLISMDYRIDETLEFGPTNPWVGLELGLLRDETTGGENQWLPWYGLTNIPTAVTGDWVRYSCMVRISDYDVLSNSSIGIYFRDTKGTISFRHPMVEIINADWSPAPEDMSTVD